MSAHKLQGVSDMVRKSIAARRRQMEIVYWLLTDFEKQWKQKSVHAATRGAASDTRSNTSPTCTAAASTQSSHDPAC